MDLLSLGIKASRGLERDRLQLVSCECVYWHYLCDDVDDRGWGCGYRSLQSICSWVCTRERNIRAVDSNHELSGPIRDVPSLKRIQEALVEAGDKPTSFVGSKEWIGSFEVCVVMDQLFGVPCKIVHVSSGDDVIHQVSILSEHFRTVGAPVMIGGDVDAASKTLIGVFADTSQPEKTKLLVADPHYQGPEDENRVFREGYVKWHGLDIFETASFYNFCLPQNIPPD